MADMDPDPPHSHPVSGVGAYTLHAGQTDPCDRAAALLAEAAKSVFGRRDLLRLAIPGGSALGAVTSLQSKLGSDWRRVALTWVDERCVDIDAPDSNQGAALAAGLAGPTATARHAVPAAILPLFLGDETPAEALRRVADKLQSEFEGGLDLTLLGMGEDGHIASIFPAAEDPSEPPGPAERNPPAWVEHITNSPKPPANRITLTRAFLKTAQRTVLVALGEGKRAPLERLLAGDERLPAYGLPDLHIVTDLAFASP
jgi:6-phosphogluconolactonase